VLLQSVLGCEAEGSGRRGKAEGKTGDGCGWLSGARGRAPRLRGPGDTRPRPEVLASQGRRLDLRPGVCPGKERLGESRRARRLGDRVVTK